jgi:hypothetical protein
MVSMLYIADKRPNTLSAKDVFDDGPVLHTLPMGWYCCGIFMVMYDEYCF